MKHFLNNRPRVVEWQGQSFRVAHEKLDGHRATLLHGFDGAMQLYGRDTRSHLEILARFPWLKTTLSLIPCSTVIDLEITAPSGRASDVPTALRDGSAQCFVIAIPLWRGLDRIHSLNFDTTRYLTAECGLQSPRFLENPPTKEQDLLLAAQDYGCEGWVLKQYEWMGWFKLKERRTVDLIVSGIDWGEGKFAGLIGSIICNDASGREVCRASGMTDKERNEATEAWDQGTLIGRIAEIAYQYVGAGGRLRHPRFMRWREDKPATEIDRV